MTGKAPPKAKAAAPAQEGPTPKAKGAAKAAAKEDIKLAEIRKQLAASEAGLANITKQMALASVSSGKADGKGKKGKAGKGSSKGQTPCWFFNTGTCSRSAEECYFSHAVLSKDEKAKLTKPNSRATSPSGWSPEPKAPGVGKVKGKGKGNDTGGVPYCYQFAKTNACSKPDGECKFAHLTQVEVDVLKAKAAACAIEVCMPVIELRELPRRRSPLHKLACASVA